MTDHRNRTARPHVRLNKREIGGVLGDMKTPLASPTRTPRRWVPLPPAQPTEIRTGAVVPVADVAADD